jgi:multiple sugar transport system substrate-binding protein
VTLQRVPLVLVGILLLVACAPAAPPTPTEISFHVFADAEEAAVYKAVVDAYEAQAKGVRVRLTAVPDQNDFMTRLSASFTAGNPPDVFLVNYRRYGQFAGKNVLEPVESWLAKSSKLKRDQFFDIPLQAFTFAGKLQCLPQNQSSLVVYYNRDILQRFGVAPPSQSWAWNDFLATAQTLTRDTDGDGRVDVHGLVAEPTIIRAAPFIWQRGGRIVDNEDSPTAVVLDDPATRDALRFFVELSTVHHVVPNEAEYKAEGPDSRFMTGKAAMTLNSRRAVPIFRTIQGFQWDVAAPPSNVNTATTLHSDAYCIAASSTNKAAAWDFTEYALGVEGQQITARLGRTVPSLKAVANSPAFLDPNQSPSNSQVFLDLAPRLKLLPIMAEWPAIERFLNEEIEAAYFGIKSLDEAIATANRKANEQIRR